MMQRDESDGLFKVVVGLAVLLAAVILYYALRGVFLGGRPASRTEAPPAKPEAAGVGRTETPPSYLPPIKLLRVEGKRGRSRRESPPAVPQPPVKAEDKK
jgi:hypothetical protein